MNGIVRYLACLVYTPWAKARNRLTRTREFPRTGPLVSVVVPVGRRDRAHEVMRVSLAAQTYKSVEMIFVDDSEHRGAGWARNQGLKRANGKYVIFLDADDFFEPTFLAALVERAERDELEMAMCLVDRYEEPWGLYSPMLNFRENPILSPTVFVRLWRLDFLREKGFKFQEIPRSNDLYFTLAATSAAKRKAVIEKVLVHYRNGQKGNLQSGNKESPDCFFKALEALKKELSVGDYAYVERKALEHNLQVNRGLSRIKIIRHLRPPRIRFLGLGPEIGGGVTYVRSKTVEWGAVVTNERPDLIIINHLKALVTWALMPHRIAIPVVFVVHGIHLRKFDFLPRKPLHCLSRFARLTLERLLYAKVDELVALNRDDVEMLRSVYGIKKPIRLEPNHVQKITAREIERTHDFMMVARFDFAKGHDILLRAIAEVQHKLRVKGKRILLIGDGQLMGEMRALTAELKIADLVDFAGAIPDAVEEMARARILVAPSRWEGSPYAVLEALAAGLKVIASDAPGNRDLVKDGENGWLFPVGDSSALAKLLVEA